MAAGYYLILFLFCSTPRSIFAPWTDVGRHRWAEHAVSSFVRCCYIEDHRQALSKYVSSLVGQTLKCKSPGFSTAPQRQNLAGRTNRFIVST